MTTVTNSSAMTTNRRREAGAAVDDAACGDGAVRCMVSDPTVPPYCPLAGRRPPGWPELRTPLPRFAGEVYGVSTHPALPAGSIVLAQPDVITHAGQFV